MFGLYVQIYNETPGSINSKLMNDGMIKIESGSQKGFSLYAIFCLFIYLLKLFLTEI